MNILTVDSSLPQSLLKASSLTAIHDVDGKLVGYYAPVTASPNAAASATAAARVDPAELKRRREDKGKWYTTAEVLDHLKSLEK